MNSQLTLKTKENLLNSCEELFVASKHLITVLNSWSLQLDKAMYLFDQDKVIVSNQLVELQKNLNNLISDTDTLKSDLDNLDLNNVSDESLENLIEKRKKLFSVLRIYLSQFSSLITALNWQSPSIKSSKNTRIGIEKSRIEADWNDYKRDRSSDTFYCEDLLKENLFISKGTGVTPVLNVFNSGMGAFASIIYFLICEEVITNKVIAYAQNYVENRMLLKKFFKDSLETFDYNDTESIVNNIITTKPNAVFLEPLSNTNNLRLLDVLDIVKKVAKVYKENIYFIFDVTCIVGFENFFDNYQIPDNIKIILHGSILKSPQLGLERVNVGFVQTFGLGELSDKILDYRTLSGTNIQDFAANMLPLTTKNLLQKRMKIIEDNAKELAEYVLSLDINKEIFGEIVYPGLSNHKDFEVSKKLGFAGTFFNIKFHDGINNDKYFELYVSAIIKIAKKYNCDLVHGASFGFNQTSIYYSVGWDEPENHYIRISTGTETKLEVEKIKLVLKEALEEFKNIYKSL